MFIQLTRKLTYRQEKKCLRIPPDSVWTVLVLLPLICPCSFPFLRTILFLCIASATVTSEIKILKNLKHHTSWQLQQIIRSIFIIVMVFFRDRKRLTYWTPQILILQKEIKVRICQGSCHEPCTVVLYHKTIDMVASVRNRFNNPWHHYRICAC